jgi:Family of unknown function (DUF6510)
METHAMRVDGNAMAGMLVEVFGREMTAALIACGGYGNVGALRGGAPVRAGARHRDALLPM